MTPVKHDRRQEYWDLIQVQKDGLTGVLDGEGRLIGGRMFKAVSPTIEPYLAEVETEDGRFVLLADGSLNPVGEIFQIKARAASGVVVRRYLDGGYEVIRPGEDPATALRFDYVDCDYCWDGEAPVAVRNGDWLKGAWRFLDLRAGDFLADGTVFNQVSCFWKGRALASLNGKQGLIDAKGRFVIPAIYDDLSLALRGVGPLGKGRSGSGVFSFSWRPTIEASPFWSFVVATKDGRSIALDASVEEGTAIEVDPALAPSWDGLLTRSDLRAATADGLWGLQDLHGAWIIPPAYRAIGGFRDGVVWVPVDDKKMWCPVDPARVTRVKPDGVVAWYPFRMSHYFPEKLAEDRYESSVLWSRAYLERRAGLRDDGPKLVGDGARGKGVMDALAADFLSLL